MVVSFLYFQGEVGLIPRICEVSLLQKNDILLVIKVFIGRFSDNIVFRRVGIFIIFFLICLFVCLFVSAKAFEPDITDQCPLHHRPVVAPPQR